MRRFSVSSWEITSQLHVTMSLLSNLSMTRFYSFVLKVVLLLSRFSEGGKMEDKMSQMESSIETIINIFHQYSVRLGHYDTLIQKEFKQLVQKELPNFLKVRLDSRQT